MSRAELLKLAAQHAANARNWAQFTGTGAIAALSSARAELAAWHAERAGA